MWISSHFPKLMYFTVQYNENLDSHLLSWRRGKNVYYVLSAGLLEKSNLVYDVCHVERYWFPSVIPGNVVYNGKLA